MADYNLHGLTPRDFQHLVQAIARKCVSAGIRPFGDGPDGGRDLISDGPTTYPVGNAPWHGYLVLGCKFLQRPSGSTKKDQTWALQQLEKDFRRYLTRKVAIRRPDYYIFATNVAFSGTAGTGGQDRFDALVEKYRGQIGIQSSSLWDYNYLRAVLDGDVDLRSTYGHFVTAGDVLAQMATWRESQRVDFIDVMHSYLQKELLADSGAKLQAAGEDPELQIPLASVFVDLPFAESADDALENKEGDSVSKVVDSLLGAGTAILRQREEELTPEYTPASRFVIVGGPGQGKSTFGQFLCQLYRASILRSRPRHLLDDRVPGVIKTLETYVPAALNSLPVHRRFPVRIELRHFAAALADNQNLSLFEYLRSDIARLGNSLVTPDDLKGWLREFPWLLVLDGLDEVPPSSNRAEVMKQIDAFRVDASSSNADLMLIATTRPQSYSREFPPKRFRHLYLRPLSSSQALEYGSKLATARSGSDERRRDELIKSLGKACENPATSRLMQSPLQVTIMATLLEDTGEPPEQRYRLFAEYYRTIYRRETRRKLLGGVLSERQKDIDTIHANTGLLIHAGGEQGGSSGKRGVDAALSDEMFRAVVLTRLRQIGITDDNIADLLGRISDSSLQRLVFLVRPRVGWVQFDIASFKEFMAAEALMNGSDESVRERLVAIASASYWRNVFLFTVGKCFLEREHLLDNLVSICMGLNENESCAEMMGSSVAGQAGHDVLLGSRLALDILTDGTARQHPGYELRFTRLALELLKQSDFSLAATLGSVYHVGLKSVYQEAIQDRLGQQSFEAQIGAWRLLANLADRGSAWAAELLDGNDEICLRLSDIVEPGGHRSDIGPWTLAQLLRGAGKINAVDFYRVTRFGRRENPELARILSLFSWNRPELSKVSIRNHSDLSNLFQEFSLVSAIQSKEDAKVLDDLEITDASWFVTASAVRFGASPDAKTLAAELTWLAGRWTKEAGKGSFTGVPWPLAACMGRVQTTEDLLRFATAAKDGELGDVDDWKAAEQRWAKDGVSNADLLCSSPALPFDARNIASVGVPIGALDHLDRNIGPNPLNVSDLLEQVPNGVDRSHLARLIWWAWAFTRGRDCKAERPDQIWRVYKLLPTLTRIPLGLSILPLGSDGRLGDEWLRLISDMPSTRVDIDRPDVPQSLVDGIVARFCAAPDEFRGILPMLIELPNAVNAVPRSVLRHAESWGGSYRQIALALQLAGELSEAETLSICETLVNSDDPTALEDGLRAVRSRPQASQAKIASTILSLLLGRERRTHLSTLVQLRRILIQYLNQLPSRLRDPLEWRRLKLPEALA